MVAVKTHQANAFLAALDRIPSAVLLYGGDAGLVAERATQLAKRLTERDSPPGEIIRLDDASLEEDPGRILVELQTAPMFGGRKVIDVDTHLTEPEDLWTKRAPAKYSGTCEPGTLEMATLATGGRLSASAFGKVRPEVATTVLSLGP